MKTLYESENGKLFYDKEECLEFEKNLNYVKSMIKDINFGINLPYCHESIYIKDKKDYDLYFKFINPKSKSQIYINDDKFEDFEFYLYPLILYESSITRFYTKDYLEKLFDNEIENLKNNYEQTLFEHEELIE